MELDLHHTLNDLQNDHKGGISGRVGQALFELTDAVIEAVGVD